MRAAGCLLEETIYAIVRSGGRQYRVEPSQLLDVDLLAAEPGTTVEMADVLLLVRNGDVQVGTPTVDGARVLAEVLEHGRDKKILVFKYKNKTRYRRRRGHRQGYTRLAIREILTAGEEPAATKGESKPVARKRAKAATKTVAEATGAPVEAAAPPAEVAAKPKRASRKAVTADAAPVKATAKPTRAVRKVGTKAAPKAPRRRTKATQEGTGAVPAEGGVEG